MTREEWQRETGKREMGGGGERERERGRKGALNKINKLLVKEKNYCTILFQCKQVNHHLILMSASKGCISTPGLPCEVECKKKKSYFICAIKKIDLTSSQLQLGALFYIKWNNHTTSTVFPALLQRMSVDIKPCTQEKICPVNKTIRIEANRDSGKEKSRITAATR